MTLIETVIYFSLFVIIVIGLVTVFQAESQVFSYMEKLDSVNDARMASWKLSRWLTFGTHVLFPPAERKSTQWFNTLLFTDQNCEKTLIYLDSEHNLKMRNGAGAQQLLAANVIDFGVRHLEFGIPDQNGGLHNSKSLVIYRIKVISQKDKKTMTLSNTIQLLNNDLRILCTNR